MDLTSNILIAGKTGVGKSTFLNYIYGEQVEKKQAGRPVTGYGLNKHDYKLGNITYTIYDTWGLEADKAEEWEELIMKEIRSRDEKLSIKDWFHTIYYCFSATSARIEEFEINHILKPLIKAGNNVAIIFTHADVPKADEKISAMKQVLQQKLGQDLAMINVCSERKALLGFKGSEPFGKEEVWDYAKRNLWGDIKNKLPIQFNKYILTELDKWYEESLQIADELKLWSRLSTLDKLESKVEFKLKQVIEQTYEVLDKTFSDAVSYYFHLMERHLEIDVQKVRKMLKEMGEVFEEEKTKFDIKNLVWLLFAIHPSVGVVSRLIQNHRLRSKLKDKIENNYYKIRRKTAPRITESYKKQLDNVGEIFLLNPPQ